MSKPDIGELVGRVAERFFTVKRAAVNAEARTAELSFSSETPVDRWYGREVLSHKPGACRLGRLQSGAPLLVNHDPEDHVGVIDSARIDGGVGRATVRFSRTEDGENALMDVADGIRANVSVGYIIHALELTSSDETGDTYTVTDWEPVEISLASIPADPSVGVGRAFHSPTTRSPAMSDPNQTPAETQEPETPATETPELNTGDTRALPQQPAVINPDAAQIRAVAAHFKLRDLGEDQIMLGATLADFRKLIASRGPTFEAIPVTPQRAEINYPSSGKLRAFRPELYAGGRREADEQAYRAGQWCKAVLFGRSDAQRWCRDYGVRIEAPGIGGIGARTLTGIGTGQSVLVPEELVLPIIDLREQYGIARRLCRVHPMNSDTASVPRVLSGVTAYFVGREAAPTANDPAFDDITLVAKNLAAETRISNDYADDSVINLADYIAQEHALAFATKEDNCLFNGDGTSTYGGIVGLRTAILSKAGAVDAASGHDTFAEIDASDLLAVMAKLPDIPGVNPVWITSKYGHNALFGRLTQAVSGNRKADLAAAMPDQWMGYQIITSPAMPKVATDLSDVAMALFGDLRMGVILGDRRGMTMIVDPYSLSSYQQTKIISSERFDLNCHGVGDASNAGPIVALIGE
jgi:HK97 family phage major capsid protein